MKKRLQLLNILFFVVTIYFNYASSAGVFNNTTQAEMSFKYQTLFTPAGYAFSIWGLIYLLLFGFVVYQSRSLFVKVADDAFVLQTGWWFILSCICNSLWCYLFVSDYILLSMLIIFCMLFCLLQILLKNSIAVLSQISVAKTLFLQLPFIIYSGWLTVACIANVTVYLTKIEWKGWGISPALWTVFMVGIATAVNVIVVWKRNTKAFALVGVWALIAIAVANTGRYEMIVYAAYTAVGVLIINSLVHMLFKRDKQVR